jgi:hypothetical protein
MLKDKTKNILFKKNQQKKDLWQLVLTYLDCSLGHDIEITPHKGKWKKKS